MKQNGFSFIELVVVLGILVTITGFVVSNYNNFNSVERLRQAGKTFKVDLRDAQTMATSGVKPQSCINSSLTLNGYQVTFTDAAGNNPAAYTITALCSNNTNVTVTTVWLPNNIIYSSHPLAITFQVLTGTTDVQYDVVLSSVGKIYTLRVSPSGDINDLGLQ